LKKRITYLFLLIAAATCTIFSCKGLTKNNNQHKVYQLPAPLPLSKADQKKEQQKLATFFNSTLLRNPGLFSGSILVAKGGHVVYENYRGFEDYPTKKKPITDSSCIHIASTSKTFTGIATLLLVQQKKLSLEDTVGKFFTNWPYPGVTVKTLLNHRSGIPNYLYFMDGANWDQQKMATNQDVLEVLLRDRPAKHAAPDKRFEYSNTNYLLLALIIEKVSGISFPDFIQTQIFEPLQMKNSFVFQLKDTNRATPSFQPGGSRWAFDHFDLTYGDKNIYSTPRDLLKWDQVLYTYQLIDKELLEAAFSPYSFERPGTHNYGLGWRLELLPNGKKIIYHFGRWHGNNSAFTRLTDENVTIIILGNKFNRSIYSVAHKSYNLFGIYQQETTKEEE
jgi:CubicO group peptidase (beta-lactamase class C family)